MDLIDRIHYKLARMPNLKQLDPRQLPCVWCTRDLPARLELYQVLCKDSTNFSKELVATYHTILHMDIETGENILYKAPSRKGKFTNVYT